ncbi:MAG: M15 family metallopeptidase [Clostridia bacterium]|nr:M15 family metallopeptidase [Clostridia bacterium]
MNQSPNRRGSGSRPASVQQRPNHGQSQQRAPLTPQQMAARRAYIERRRREIRRNRIILGVACAVILLLLIFLISVIVKGIGAAISSHEEVTEAIDTEAYIDVITDAAESVIGTLGNDGPQPVIPSQTEADLSYEAMQFASDLTEFEKYMNPTEERDDYLILVNASHALTAADNPTDLVDVTNTRTDRSKQQMRKTAERALQALYIEARAQGMMSPDTPSGYPLSVTSAYRSYETQNYLFSNYTQQEMAEHPGWTKAQAEADVLTYSCRPGTSEHQTGLACDMHTLTGADVSFANYEQAVWLAENCWKFGYILRFPKDKVAETGISYEPWHFRYVGRYHAYRIWSQGLCLEEYIAMING